MSLRWVESVTPIVDEAALLETLERMHERVTCTGGVVTLVSNPQIQFSKRHGAYVLHRTSDMRQRQWEGTFRQTFAEIQTERARRRQEERSRRADLVASRLSAGIQASRAADEEARAEVEARRQLVEGRRQDILERAKSMGYTVREDCQGTDLRLILVRRTY